MSKTATSRVRIALCALVLVAVSVLPAAPLGKHLAAAALRFEVRGGDESRPPSVAGEIPLKTLEASTQAVASRIAQVSVRIETNDGMGSGTIVGREGLILTSAHVIEGCPRIEVCTPDGRLFRARVLGLNGQGDLALLKIPAQLLAVAVTGNSNDLKLGSWVLAAGHPTSAFDDSKPSLSIGRIRELNGSIDAGEEKSFRRALVSDVPLSAGSSGGGLFDLQGRLIGVNAAVTRDERRAFSVRIEEYLVDSARFQNGEHFDRVPRRTRAASRYGRGPTRRAWFDHRWRASRGAQAVEGRWAQLRLADGSTVSAIHVDARGDLLASAASLESCKLGDRIEVRRGRKSLGSAIFVGRDLVNGVALLRLKSRPGGWRYLDLKADQALGDGAQGSLVMVPGRGGYRGGIVASALRRPPNEMRGLVQSGYWPKVLQCDLRLSASHQGAPLVTRQGHWLGMVLQHRLRLSKSRWEREPYGIFVLPRSAMAESYRYLARNAFRAAPRLGYFGVGLENLTQGELRRLQLTGAVRVTVVEKGWPADLGGMSAGDLLVAIDGKPVRGRAPAIERIAKLQPGQDVPVTLFRNGRRVHCQVRAGDRRQPPRTPEILASQR